MLFKLELEYSLDSLIKNIVSNQIYKVVEINVLTNLIRNYLFLALL